MYSRLYFIFVKKGEKGFGEEKYPVFPAEIWMHHYAFLSKIILFFVVYKIK
jgi:hypothetical protein